jgi:hypothetical protein
LSIRDSGPASRECRAGLPSRPLHQRSRCAPPDRRIRETGKPFTAASGGHKSKGGLRARAQRPLPILGASADSATAYGRASFRLREEDAGGEKCRASRIVVVLMAALLCATPALAQYQSPSTSAAAGGSCSGSNFVFPDANGHILQCVSSVWTAVSDAVWSVSGSSIYYNGGNVGIGNMGPSYPLDVTGDIRTSTCLHYASSTLGTCSSDPAIKRDVAPYVVGLSVGVGVGLKSHNLMASFF